MNRQTRERIITLLRPPFLLVSFIVSGVFKALFWLPSIWSQRKDDEALWSEVQSNLYFLSSQGQRIETIGERRTKVLPFDYATVVLVFKNLCFYFTKGRRELNVSIAPRYARNDPFELRIVIAALDAKGIEEIPVAEYLSDIGDLLRPRVEAINDAFSETRYLEFRKKLSAVKDHVRVLTRQAEWELNRRLYPQE